MQTEIQEKTVKTFRALRYLDIGESKRSPGELVPEAITWLRYEHHVNCGYLEEVTVSEETYLEAVEKYCPDLKRELGVTSRRRK